MNKREFIEALAAETDVTKAAASRAVDTMLNIVTKRLSKGEDVVIAGFGTFTIAKRAARKARNPRTGEAVKVPATKVPKFRAGATLKVAVAPKKRS